MELKRVLIVLLVSLMANVSYAKRITEEEYVVEESGLNVTKITDESQNSVVCSRTDKKSQGFLERNVGLAKSLGSNISLSGSYGTFAKSFMSGSKRSKLVWSPVRTLSLSPDGTELAYVTRKNKEDNVMVRKITGSGASTQRTFRNVVDFCWGADDNLYISDYADEENSMIGIVDAHKGTSMRQLTSNNSDRNPATIDGKIVFFTRIEPNGPMIWSYNTETGELVSCARGYQAVPVSDEEFLCVRNSTDGNSEIWRVNYANGEETLILSNREQGYSNPSLSPDGQWIILQANAKSASSKKQNIDIFVVRPDGTNLTQLTYHPSDDMCPTWSSDGKSIYFISSRGTKDGAYNIWKMNFAL